MSRLLEEIRAAQVRAAEGVVVANLRRMGLDHSQQPRHIADAPVALAASLTAQAQTRELNNLRTERDTLLNALRQIATTDACSNSDPDVMGAALDNAVAIAQGALRACQHHKTRPVAPEAAAIGAGLDPESIEQGDHQ